jgi:hypothetical protein
MHLADLIGLASEKFGEPARYYYRVVYEDGGRFAQAEVFASARAGANVPDEFKTKRVKATVPFAKVHHNPTGTAIVDPAKEAAHAKLVELLEALP